MFDFLIVARCSPNLHCKILGAVFFSVFAPKLELGLCHCDKISNNSKKYRKRKKVSSDAQVWRTAHHGGEQGAGAELKSHGVRSQEAEMNAATQPTFSLFSFFFFLFAPGL